MSKTDVNMRIMASNLSRAEQHLSAKLEDLVSAEDPLERAEFSGFLEGAEFALHTLGFSTNLENGRARIFPHGYDANSMSVAETAEYIGLSEPRVRQLLTENPPKLLGHKSGKSWVVSRESADEYKANHPKRWARA